MNFAINVPNFGTFGHPQLLAELAHEAEEAGWNGFFIWDHIDPGPDLLESTTDPWIALAAIAMVTSTIKLGPLVTPIPRRRPTKLAREIVALDHLSHGRVILGLGIGTDRRKEYSRFGETTDSKQHAEMLDEALEILTDLWSGELFSYAGKHYQLQGVQFLPKPIQQPRIPIWIAGTWPHKKPFQRAAQWDGITPICRDRAFVAEDYHEISAYIQTYRSSGAPFDIIASGQTTGTDQALDHAVIAAHADAGVTWWQESLTWQTSIEQARLRIHQGPPRL